MAEFIYSTETTIPGPWLVDADKLEALDRVLDDEWQRLAQRNREAISRQVARRVDESIDVRFARTKGEDVSPKQLELIRNEAEKSV